MPSLASCETPGYSTLCRLRDRVTRLILKRSGSRICIALCKTQFGIAGDLDLRVAVGTGWLNQLILSEAIDIQVVTYLIVTFQTQLLVEIMRLSTDLKEPRGENQD